MKQYPLLVMSMKPLGLVYYHGLLPQAFLAVVCKEEVVTQIRYVCGSFDWSREEWEEAKSQRRSVLGINKPDTYIAKVPSLVYYFCDLSTGLITQVEPARVDSLPIVRGKELDRVIISMLDGTLDPKSWLQDQQVRGLSEFVDFKLVKCHLGGWHLAAGDREKFERYVKALTRTIAPVSRD